MLQLHAQISTRWVWLLGKGGGPRYWVKLLFDPILGRPEGLNCGCHFLFFLSLYTVCCANLGASGLITQNIGQRFGGIWGSAFSIYKSQVVPSGPKRDGRIRNAGWPSYSRVHVALPSTVCRVYIFHLVVLAVMWLHLAGNGLLHWVFLHSLCFVYYVRVFCDMSF